MAFTTIVSDFLSLVDSVGVLSREYSISKIKSEIAKGKGSGRCTASKSMAERAQRGIGVSGRIQCVVVISVRCCQRIRRLLLPTTNLKTSLGRAPHLNSSWPSAILKRRQIIARG